MIIQGERAEAMIKEEPAPDMVNSPSHYNQGGIECIDCIAAMLGPEGFVAYCRGNAIKYTWRAGLKLDAEEDLAKAAWYNRMAAGDDPRCDAKPPNEALRAANNRYHEALKSGELVVDGFVPWECDTRPPCEHDLYFEVNDEFPTCRKCSTQPLSVAISGPTVEQISGPTVEQISADADRRERGRRDG